MSELRALVGFLALTCGLALASSLDTRIGDLVTVFVLIVLGLGAAAGAVAYAVHIRRIRRAIERGNGMRWERTVDPTVSHRPGEPRVPPRRDPRVSGATPRPPLRPPRTGRGRRPYRRSPR